MEIESIHHEPIENTNSVTTTVVIKKVPSQCILARLIIDALGRPGIDNDLEMIGSGDTWTIIWTQPSTSREQTQARILKAIA